MNSTALMKQLENGWMSTILRFEVTVKHKRFDMGHEFNLEFGHGDPNNEPISESHRDESTYAAIHSSHSEE